MESSLRGWAHTPPGSTRESADDSVQHHRACSLLLGRQTGNGAKRRATRSGVELWAVYPLESFPARLDVENGLSPACWRPTGAQARCDGPSAIYQLETSADARLRALGRRPNPSRPQAPRRREKQFSRVPARWVLAECPDAGKSPETTPGKAFAACRLRELQRREAPGGRHWSPRGVLGREQTPKIECTLSVVRIQRSGALKSRAARRPFRTGFRGATGPSPPPLGHWGRHRMAG